MSLATLMMLSLELLAWDDNNFYWKGKKYNKAEWQGRKDAPWEKDANKEAGTNYGR